MLLSNINEFMKWNYKVNKGYVIFKKGNGNLILFFNLIKKLSEKKIIVNKLYINQKEKEKEFILNNLRMTSLEI